MKKLASVLSLLAAVTAAQTARADESSGLTLGVRGGFAMPLGSAGDDADLDHLTKGAVPVQLEAGWRFNRKWLGGAYFAWGPALIASNAKGALQAQGASSIGGHAVQRVGVQAIYTVFETPRFAQWAGVGAGYEWTRYAEAKVRSATGTGDAELGLRGLEAILQIGGDFKLSPRLAIGPFATLSFGQYRSRVSDVDVTSGTMENAGATSSRIQSKGIHEWFQYGLRARFDL